MQYEVLEKAFEGENPKSVFEVGCSNGTFLRELHEKYNAEVGGLDINPKDVEIAKKNFPEYSQNFIHFDISDRWPIKDKSYDIVFSMSCLTLIPDIQKAIEEMKRVGKKVILIEPPDPKYKDIGFNFIEHYNGREIWKSSENI